MDSIIKDGIEKAQALGRKEVALAIARLIVLHDKQSDYADLISELWDIVHKNGVTLGEAAEISHQEFPDVY